MLHTRKFIGQDITTYSWLHLSYYILSVLEILKPEGACAKTQYTSKRQQFKKDYLDKNNWSKAWCNDSIRRGSYGITFVL